MDCLPELVLNRLTLTVTLPQGPGDLEGWPGEGGGDKWSQKTWKGGSTSLALDHDELEEGPWL